MSLLNSFTYIHANNKSPELNYEIYKTMQKWKKLFHRYNKTQHEYEDAFSKTFLEALKFYDENRGTSLDAYISKYAETINKDKIFKREIPVDFMEESLADGEEDMQEVNHKHKNPGIDNELHPKVNDFSDGVIANADMENHSMSDIQKFILEDLGYFLTFCEAVKAKDTTTGSYSNSYIKRARQLFRAYRNFNAICLKIYEQFEAEMRWFLKVQMDFEVTTKLEDADFTLSKPENLSKRIKLLNKQTHQPIKDADTEEFVVDGKLNTKVKQIGIYKINYVDAMETLIDKISDEENNEFVFHLGKHSIIRTLHSSTFVDGKASVICNILKMELVTNVLKAVNGKLLNIGVDNIYIIRDRVDDLQIKPIEAKGLTLNFTVQDITDEVEFI